MTLYPRIYLEASQLSPTTNSLQALRRLGQSVWYDNMYRALIGSGELQRLIDSGVTGLTSNPNWTTTTTP